MKPNIKLIISVLGIGIAILWLTGCHHVGGGCAYAPVSVPVQTVAAPASVAPSVNSSPSAIPASPDSPIGHSH